MGRSSLAPSQPIHFFILAVAYSIGWTAISSELARFAGRFGNNILLQLNLAYYLPSVPLLVLQALLDAAMDVRFGEHRSNLFRMLAGYGGCTAILAAFPHTQASRPQLLASTAALGLATSIAFGSSYQLVSKFQPGSTVALTLGFVCSAPLVLVLEAALRHGPCCQQRQVRLLYSLVAAVAATGLAAALLLLRRYRSWRRQQMAGSCEALMLLITSEGGEDVQDHQEGGGQEQQQLAGFAPCVGRDGSPATSTGAVAAAAALQRQQSGALSTDVGHAALLERSVSELAATAAGTLASAWPAALALSLSVGTSMFLFPFFTHFPSTPGPWSLGPMLPVVLFWVRCFSDILGRLVPKACTLPPTPTTLLALTALKTATVPLALLYIHGCLPPWLHSDAYLAAYVALQWLLSGSINTWAYLVLPQLVPPELTVQAASVMTLAFNASCLAGLLCAVPFQAMLPPGAL